MKYFLPLAVLLILLNGCAPVFSDLQSARTVGKNHVEATPLFTAASYHEDGKAYKMQNQFGIQAAYGITSRIDFRLRYEYINIADDDYYFHIIGFGPKFSVLENRIAFSLPVGTAFGDGINNAWQIHPTMLFTVPLIDDNIEITVAPKYIWTLHNGDEDYFAVNLNAALSTNLNRWAVRPEYGLFFNPGDHGYFGQFSIGLSINFGKTEAD